MKSRLSISIQDGETQRVIAIEFPSNFPMELPFIWLATQQRIVEALETIAASLELLTQTGENSVTPSLDRLFTDELGRHIPE